MSRYPSWRFIATLWMLVALAGLLVGGKEEAGLALLASLQEDKRP